MISTNEQAQAAAAQIKAVGALAAFTLELHQRLDAMKAELVSTVETVAILMRHIPGDTAEAKYQYLCEHTDLSDADRMALWSVLSPHSGQASEFDGEARP